MKKQLICGLFFMLGLISCQDMDLLPKDKIPAENYWKTPADFEKGANQFYGYLLSFHGDNNLASYDLQSDLAVSYFGFNNVSNGRWLPSENDEIWSDSYARLRQINILIERANALGTEDAKILRYKGEALFFRAYVSFNLVKRFGDVPLVTKELDVDSPELFMARTPRTDVENAILADLTEAAKYLPHKTEIAKESAGRITWGAAMAFKARTALFFGTWAQNHKHRLDFVELLTIAKESANALMPTTNLEYDLFTALGTDSYRKLFLEDGDNSCESILDRQYGQGVGKPGNGTTHPNTDNATAGYFGGVTKKFTDMILDKNGLPITAEETVFKGYGTIEDEFANRDPRMASILQIPGHEYYYPGNSGKLALCSAKFADVSSTKTGYKLLKYISEKPGIYHGLGYNNAKVIRFAEVLLIYAEASYELDGKISDETLDKTINRIRERAGMPRLTNSFVTKNGLDMRNEIRRERTVELCFEASRYDDLRRWKTAEIELPMPLVGVKFAAYADANEGIENLKLDANGFVIAEENRRFNPRRDYLAPLPTKQILMSSGVLKQNPGWQ